MGHTAKWNQFSFSTGQSLSSYRKWVEPVHITRGNPIQIKGLETISMSSKDFHLTEFIAIMDKSHRGVAQPGSAQRSGRWGHGFESHRPDHQTPASNNNPSVGQRYKLVGHPSESNFLTMPELNGPIDFISLAQNIGPTAFDNQINRGFIQSYWIE